ncbi:uncharacterized protein LOC113790249 isoform X2 [Dermatophagoides pteronyssinus]|uniref:uncharacterized protein LOC113790249 isoform X2 n=1 Tax=Dermatophagoides pteronyssinus TaxID=6956 RepID=UPI003F668122
MAKISTTTKTNFISSSSSMATMIMNGVTMPSISRNGGPTAKFLIKSPMNGGSALHSNFHNQNNEEDGDGELTQNINIEHNPNKNIDDNYHHHLHIPGHNSSTFGYNVNIDDDQAKMMNSNILEIDHRQQTRTKKYSVQNNGNVIERNGVVPLLNRHNSNITTVPSCTISINGGHNQQSDQKSIPSNHHNHRFHRFFGSSSSSSSSSPSPSTPTTATETTMSSNLSLNGHRKKSWKTILCSWILTILAILIIIGISFASGLLAAQYIYKSYCDVSSISSERNHLISSNNQQRLSSQDNDGQNQRIGRFNRLGHIWSYTTKTPENNNNSNNIENSTLNINTTTLKPISMVIYSVDPIKDDLDDNKFNQNLSTTTESKINDDNDSIMTTTTTTTTLPPNSNRSRNFVQQNPTSPQPFTSETPLSLTTISSPENKKDENEKNDGNEKTISKTLSSSPTPPTTTMVSTSESSNFLSTLIDEYNQSLNETINETSHEAGDILYPIFNFSSTPVADMTTLEFQESNRTEIISEEVISNSTTVEDEITQTTTIDPSTELRFNSTNSVNVPSINSSIDPDSYLVPSWFVPDDLYDQTESVLSETTTMRITEKAMIDDENLSSTFFSNDTDINDDEFTTEISNNKTDSLNNVNETINGSNDFITTTLLPETNRTGRIFSSTEKVEEIDDEHLMIHNENTTITNDINKTNQTMAINNVTNLPIIEQLSASFCLDTQFQCPNTTSSECFDKSHICDGIVDCPQDHFDELDCMEKNCGQNFRCGQSIPPVSVADVNETIPFNNFSIAMETVSIKSKSIEQCIPRSYYCDGIWDCIDGSDEIDCHIDKCEVGKVLCRDNSACITGKQACDGLYNCRDRSDEAGCDAQSTCESKGKFYCDDNALCISKSLVCDGIADCLNGADEKECVKSETCSAEDSKFFCQNSAECIDRSKRCDNHVDCMDYSDEDRCIESDLEDFVYAYNSAKNHWSLLCVNTLFNHDDADQICTKMGMSYAVDFTTIKIGHLLNESTWAIFSNSSSSKIASFEDICMDNLTPKIVCANLYCDSREQFKKPNLTWNEIPTPIHIHNSTNSNQTCVAYTLSPKWLLTSGQCLINSNLTHQNLTANVGGKEFPIERVRVHTKYSVFRTIRFPDYDMALIETSDTIPEQLLNHSSICLPSSKLDPEITCFIGNYRNSDTAFKVLESSYCNSTKHFAGSLTDRFVCAAEDGGNSNVQSKPGVCLPPYLPLICLSSQSYWYIAGYSSHQHGCDPLTGHPIFRGYLPHPTLFSNLFAMKPFIDQTLGRGTYRQKRLKLNEISHHNGPEISERPNVNEAKRAVFLVAGSVEEQQWMMEQDARKQKSININNTNTINANGNSTIKTDLKTNFTVQNFINNSNDSEIKPIIISNSNNLSSNEMEKEMIVTTTLIPSTGDVSNFTNENVTFKDENFTVNSSFLLNNSSETDESTTEQKFLSNSENFIGDITTTTTTPKTTTFFTLEMTSIDIDHIINETMSILDESTFVPDEQSDSNRFEKTTTKTLVTNTISSMVPFNHSDFQAENSFKNLTFTDDQENETYDQMK